MSETNLAIVKRLPHLKQFSLAKHSIPKVDFPVINWDVLKLDQGIVTRRIGSHTIGCLWEFSDMGEEFEYAGAKIKYAVRPDKKYDNIQQNMFAFWALLFQRYLSNQRFALEFFLNTVQKPSSVSSAISEYYFKKEILQTIVGKVTNSISIIETIGVSFSKIPTTADQIGSYKNSDRLYDLYKMGNTVASLLSLSSINLEDHYHSLVSNLRKNKDFVITTADTSLRDLCKDTGIRIKKLKHDSDAYINDKVVIEKSEQQLFKLLSTSNPHIGYITSHQVLDKLILPTTEIEAL